MQPHNRLTTTHANIHKNGYQIFSPLSKITLQQVNRFVKLAIFEITKYCSFIADKPFYHTSNSHECMEVNGEALQLCKVYKKKTYFSLQVAWESVTVLQVMQESVSGATSQMHCAWTCNESKICMIEIVITIVPSYTRKISLVYWRWHCYSCCTQVTIQTATNWCHSFVLWWYILQKDSFRQEKGERKGWRNGGR